MSLNCGLLKPLCGLLVALWDTSSLFIRGSKRGLCIGMSLKSCLLEPFDGPPVASFASTAVSVATPKVGLCKTVSLGSTLVEQLERLFITLWDTESELMRSTKGVLGIGIALKCSLPEPLCGPLVALFASQPVMIIIPCIELGKDIALLRCFL